MAFEVHPRSNILPQNGKLDLAMTSKSYRSYILPLNCKQDLVTTSKSYGFWCPSKKSYPITVLQTGPGHNLEISWLLRYIQNIISKKTDLKTGPGYVLKIWWLLRSIQEVISYHWIVNLAWLCPLKFMSFEVNARSHILPQNHKQDLVTTSKSYGYWYPSKKSYPINELQTGPQNFMAFEVHPWNHMLH